MRSCILRVRSRTPSVVVAAALAVSAAPLASAQTTWAVEGSTPSYGEFNAPPPLCPVGLVPYAVNAPPVAACPTNAFFPPLSCVGGSAVDQDGNPLSGGAAVPVMIHSDGITLEMTTAAGAYITSGPVGGGAVLPGLITGVACDSITDTVYLTDGVMAVGVGVPPGPAGCAPPPIVVPPFTIISTPGVRICGLGYDPCTGTLWACDAAGGVSNFAIGGAFLGGFLASPPLGAFLSGCSVNLTNGNIQVTDGIMVAEFTPAGALAAPGAFYLSANPYAVPLWAGGVDGLGFSLRPQTYGTGCSTLKPTPPSIGFLGGYPWAGNAGFAVQETAAFPGTSAFLVISFGYSCPPLAFGCGGFWVRLPWFLLLPQGLVPGSGIKTTPAPLPAAVPPPCGLPVGVPLYFQYFNFGGGGMEQSNALALTIGAI